MENCSNVLVGVSSSGDFFPSVQEDIPVNRKVSQITSVTRTGGSDPAVEMGTEDRHHERHGDPVSLLPLLVRHHLPPFVSYYISLETIANVSMHILADPKPLTGHPCLALTIRPQRDNMNVLI